ncbi:hypothetical protein [Spiroplasma sp. BIUS-1]|uniref:hypothetical protein n=1 Tax=Spiroplasma sp. BIUS-1 TaxID=216964 RepID=UPI001398AD58|nr:hypothetical protein [Spiroplasma sp. BIUS-1]QHX36652.1 hypothetical protein SBIUS_v1c03990 [Spiroplasma sp. BIUS-1]
MATITMVSSTTLAVTSCGNNNTGSSFYDTDYNKAFGMVFSNEKNTNFSMLPTLAKKQTTEPPKNVDTNNKVDQLELVGSNLKIDCDNFVCTDDNSFTGSEISKKEYNTTDNDRVLIQYALDDLGKWFSIEPDASTEVFYDFSNLTMNINYANNNYYFNKYSKKDEPEELILWSQQNSLTIRSENKTFDNNLSFFDKEISLNTELINKLLESNSVIVNDSDLVVTFNNVEQQKVWEKVVMVQDLFDKYQSDLRFEENKNPTYSNSRTFTSLNLKPFIIESKTIKNIKVITEFKDQGGVN